MKNKEFQKEIKDILVKYPKEIYPNSIGVYKEEKDGERKPIFYYEDKNRWYSTENKNRYTFDPVRDVYQILQQGYQPFYIADEIHIKCWDETYNQFADIDDILTTEYHHGRRLYFDYCISNGIDSDYMENLDVEDAMASFNSYDDKLQEFVSETLNSRECKCVDEVSLKNYEYMLNEPYYDNLKPMYTLHDQIDSNDAICYFSYEDQCVVLINGLHIQNLYEWGFDFETSLFEPLSEGSVINYMSIDTHRNILYTLENNYKDVKCYEKGIKIYLNYCIDNHVYKHLPKAMKDIFKEQCRLFDIDFKLCTKNMNKDER